jgi:hypothetical protein
MEGLSPASLQGVKLTEIDSDVKGWDDVGGTALAAPPCCCVDNVTSLVFETVLLI